MTEPPDLPEIGFADADQRTVHIDKPEGQEGKVMDASWITDEGTHCDACLSRPALGLLTLHTDDGHHVASWWTVRCLPEPSD